MSQFSENDCSLTPQLCGETFSIDLEQHAEGFPFHKWESLDHCGLPTLDSLTGTKTYRPNFLVWAMDCKEQTTSVIVLVLLYGPFTHPSKKVINSENECKARGVSLVQGRREIQNRLPVPG